MTDKRALNWPVADEELPEWIQRLEADAEGAKEVPLSPLRKLAIIATIAVLGWLAILGAVTVVGWLL